MVEEIKRWIAERRLGPGDKLPKEDELQELFGVSKGTAREALKSLEVQGLVTVTTGPAGGATIGEVPLERAFQLLQNYLFFRELDVAQIYAVRRVLEPELAAGAVPHLTEEHFAALERSIETCAPHPATPWVCSRRGSRSSAERRRSESWRTPPGAGTSMSMTS